MKAKISRQKFKKKQNIFIASNIFLKILINYKMGTSHFTINKLGWHHISHAIKVSITTNKTHWHHMPTNIMHWKRHNIISEVFLPKLHDLNQVMRKQHTIQNWGVFDKIPNHCSSWLIQIKIKKMRNHRRPEETKYT